MSSNNDPLQPTPFDVASPSPAEHTEASTPAARGTPAWVLPAFGGLLLLAAVVIFWLPERVATPTEEPPTTSETTTGESAPAAEPAEPERPAPATEDASPWSEAQLAKLRKEAQDVLQELLDIQFALEERGVQTWAPEPFAAASEVAAASPRLLLRLWRS